MMNVCGDPEVFKNCSIGLYDVRFAKTPIVNLAIRDAWQPAEKRAKRSINRDPNLALPYME